VFKLRAEEICFLQFLGSFDSLCEEVKFAIIRQNLKEDKINSNQSLPTYWFDTHRNGVAQYFIDTVKRKKG